MTVSTSPGTVFGIGTLNESPLLIEIGAVVAPLRVSVNCREIGAAPVTEPAAPKGSGVLITEMLPPSLRMMKLPAVAEKSHGTTPNGIGPATAPAESFAWMLIGSPLDPGRAI